VLTHPALLRCCGGLLPLGCHCRLQQLCRRCCRHAVQATLVSPHWLLLLLPLLLW
jgi:hypothetical protein